MGTIWSPGISTHRSFAGSHLAAFMCMSFGTKRSGCGVMTVSLMMWTALAASLTGAGIHYFAPDSNGLPGDILISK
ncbi:hypothetical protein ACEQPO_10315 [Bacillus sp. SL00103]